MNRLSGVAGLGLLLGLILTPAVVRAETEPNCSFEERFARLRAIQADGSQNYIDAIRAQLEVRKSILRSVVDCAIKDVRDRRSKLGALPAEFQDPKIQSEIAKGLEKSEEYYVAKKESIDNLGIKGTQDLAKEIASWRADNHIPLAERQDSFFVWSQNQPLFAKAKSRFSQMRPVVLSLTILDKDEITSSFKEAEADLEKAEEANDAAKEALATGDRKAPELVKTSLEPLSSIYKIFLNLSEDIKKIVP